MLSHFSCVWLFATLWVAARQTPLSIGCSWQEYWSGLPCPPPGELPDPGIKPASLMFHALAGGFFTISTTSDAHCSYKFHERTYYNIWYTISPWWILYIWELNAYNALRIVEENLINIEWCWWVLILVAYHSGFEWEPSLVPRERCFFIFTCAQTPPRGGRAKYLRPVPLSSSRRTWKQ